MVDWSDKWTDEAPRWPGCSKWTPQMPGTDTSFRVPQVPHCFTPEQKMEFLRNLDLVGCADEGLFQATLNIEQDDTQASVSTSIQMIQIFRLLESLGFDSSALIELKTGLEARVLTSTGIDILRLLELELGSALKAVDSTLLDVYTETSSGVQVAETWYVIGSRDFESVSRVVTEVRSEGKLALNPSSARVGDLLLIRVEKPLTATVMARTMIDLGFLLRTESRCQVRTGLDIHSGYGVRGYGIGQYGK